MKQNKKLSAQQNKQAYKQRMLFLKLFMGGLIIMATLNLTADVNIFSNNKAEAAIVIPEKIYPSLTLALDELKYHLKKATGNDFAHYSENQVPVGKYKSLIYLGNCKKTWELGIDFNKLKAFSGGIKTEENDLYIYGNDAKDIKLRRNKRGCLNSSTGSLMAVYDFLEKELNIRWIWPGELGTVVPRVQNIILGDINRQVKLKLIESDFWFHTAPRYMDMGWGKKKIKINLLHQ